MGSVYITDYIDNPNIERSILGDRLSQHLGEETRVILVWHERIDDAFLDKAPNLKGVVRYGVGIDNVDSEACRKRGINFCNTQTPGRMKSRHSPLHDPQYPARASPRYDHLCRTLDIHGRRNVIGSLRAVPHVRPSGSSEPDVIGGLVSLKARSLNIPETIYDPTESRATKNSGVGRAYS